MRRKKVIVRQPEENNTKYVDPNPDFLGFERTMDKLAKSGFVALREDGVLMVESSGKDIYEIKSDIERIISACEFRGSWGIRKYHKKD